MPTVPDSSFADWLKNGALYVTVAPAGAGAWAGKGVTTEITTPLATKAGAQAEGARQAAFMGGPNVKDRIIIAGSRKDLFGKCFTAKGDRLGYDAGGQLVFVIGADEQDNGSTILTVIKRLAT